MTKHTIKAEIFNKNQLIYKILRVSFAPDGEYLDSTSVGEFQTESGAIAARDALNKWDGSE